ncbi:MAG: DNA/RNA nuclease SfsA [Lachnospiraceae bacterium]|nr:DNA/RNA nuclease SfsA [Lachnospiraceae bacterium]
MKYTTTKRATFLSRPNRFVAYVSIDGHEEKVHVKNTGRCKELLVPGCDVILAEGQNEKRATKYDLIGVYKNGQLINMDSQAPNKVVHEFLKETGRFGEITYIKPEYTYENSRIDFYFETSDGKKHLMEVKGVTLEREHHCFFPDAPTARGVKHMLELKKAHERGFETYLMFVIQLEGVMDIAPNDETDPLFGSEFRNVTNAGVKALAYDCTVKEDELLLNKEIIVKNSQA